VFFRSVVKIAAVALAGWLPLGTAQAATVGGISATFDITGDYEFSSPQGGPNVFSVNGTFAGTLDSFDPYTTTPYRLGAWLTITDDLYGTVFDDGGSIVTPPVTPIDVYFDVATYISSDPFLSGLVSSVVDAFITAGEPGGLVIDLSPTDIFSFSWALDYINPTGLGGTYALSLTTDEIFSATTLPGGVSAPDNGSGDFALSLSVTPVPLPPMLPVLGFAVAGLWAMRRRLS
jgi:hypothetical protein